MAEYVVQSTDARTFTLRADAAVLGELKYTEWFSLKAVLSLADGTSLRIEPKGFWETTVELKDQDSVLLSFKMNWEGNIVLKSRLGGLNRAFALKNQGVFKSAFHLLDKQGQELLTVRPDFKWSKVNYDYKVVSSDVFETFEDKDIILLVAVHCANYYMTMVSTMFTTIVAVT